MRFSIIIPTFDHQETLNYSIHSVLQQTFQDFEILVVGDGAPEKTRDIMTEWCRRDGRIRYFDHPKGDAHGEIYRHEAILASRGEYIYYLCDDDLWLPNHLSVLYPYLLRFDFVSSCFVLVDPDGKVNVLEGQISDPAVRQRMITEKWNLFGPTSVAHSKRAYLRLPKGWHPRPDGIWSDLYMWRQWMTTPGMSFFSIPAITTAHFPSPMRTRMTLDERIHELREYSGRLGDMKFKEEMESYRKSQSKLFSSEAHPYLAGMNDVIALLGEKLTESKKEVQTKNEKIRDMGREIQELIEDRTNIKNAWSTRLGFLLTWPIRKIMDL